MSFKLDKAKIARCFRRAHASYDHHGVVQKKVGEELIDILSAFPQISYKRVLEVGCCTGVMTEALCKRFSIGTFFVNDLVPEFQQTVIDRLPHDIRQNIKPLFGDIEELNLPGNLDLVVSSATFQWLENLTGFFRNVAASLNENGYLVFSLFGPGTLAEFKQLTGIGLHYYELDDLVNKLEDHFELKLVKSRKERVYFPTPHLILKHFQATGVGGVSEYRWTSKDLKKFEKEYQEQFGTAEGLPVSYLSTFIVALKR